MALLKACSQAYILMTLIPVMTSFMIRTLLSVSLADFNLMGGFNERTAIKLMQILKKRCNYHVSLSYDYYDSLLLRSPICNF